MTIMAKIRMLSGEVIGKIAAGEVVERPAAAIKELVENSLDAGAKRITVEIQEGGTESFRVTDDGCGIDGSDIRMAFERHATSKIRTEEDLNAVETLGFRGEALASIAAVSRVTLTTRTKDRETAIRVRNEGGMITEMSEAASAPGTGILVRDLFYNVPVRKGFLKKPATETNAVTDLMIRLILSRPDVSFRYLADGRMIYHSPGDGKTESAVLAIYGSAAARTMRKVDGHQGGILISGYVGVGENARSNRSGESFFINGRMLRSPLLSGSLEEACRERVMIGKFPICALYMEMPPENVNVNVHPNKMEVRFRFDQQVLDAVFTLVREALQDRDAFERPVEMPLSDPRKEELPEPAIVSREGVPELPRRAEVETGNRVPGIEMREAPPTPVYRPVDRGERISVDPLKPAAPLPPLRTGSQSTVSSPAAGGQAALRVESQVALPSMAMENQKLVVPPTEESQYSVSSTAGESQAERPPLAMGNQNPAFPSTPETQFSLPPQAAGNQEIMEQLSAMPPDLPAPMRVFGALFDTYILIEYEDHLLMVDQHAAHERLLFDRMMKAYEEQRAGQEMLVPYIVPVTKKDMAVLEEHQELLRNLGLTAEPFSETEVAVRSVPVTLGQHETSAFLREAIDELESGRIPGADRKRAAILQLACKHAVKGGERIPEEILRSLVEEMIDRKVTPTCPHGRPLVVSISRTELDKKFRRIQ